MPVINFGVTLSVISLNNMYYSVKLISCFHPPCFIHSFCGSHLSDRMPDITQNGLQEYSYVIQDTLKFGHYCCSIPIWCGRRAQIDMVDLWTASILRQARKSFNLAIALTLPLTPRYGKRKGRNRK